MCLTFVNVEVMLSEKNAAKGEPMFQESIHKGVN